MFTYQINDDAELKLLSMDHDVALFKLVDENREHLRKWLPWIDRTVSVDDTREFLQIATRQFADNNGFQAGIWYKGEMAGVIGYHMVNWQHRHTSIGYWLGEKYQGKGLMTMACKAFIDHAFDGWGLNRIEIRCAEANYSSRAIPERLDFQEEGFIRCGEWLYDHFVDHVVYGLLVSDLDD